MRPFSEQPKKIKVMMVLGINIVCAVLIWIGISLLFWLFNFKITHTFETFVTEWVGKLEGWRNLLIGLGVSFGITLFCFLRYHKKFGGRFIDKDKQISKTDYSAKWLKQDELEEKMVIIKDETKPSYPLWTIEGINDVKDSKGKKVTGITYNILACDKKVLSDKLKKEGKDERINNGKLVKSLVAGSTIVYGGAGSGKSWQVIIPTILHLLNSNSKSSMVVTDLKGDIYKKTAKIAEANGYNIYRFNTNKPEFSNSWNPLSEIWEIYYNDYLKNWTEWHKLKMQQQKSQPGEMSRENPFSEKWMDAKSKIQKKLEQIATTICPVENSGKDVFWNEMAQKLIKLYFLLILDYGIEKKDYTLFNVSSNVNLFQDRMIILQDLLPEWALSKHYVSEFKGGSERNDIRSIQSIAFSKLEMFTNQEIKNLTSSNNAEIDFDKFITEPTVIYISYDPSEKEGASNKLAVLFMELLYNHLNKYLFKNNLIAFEKAILFIIDEFGNLPKIDFLQKMFSLDRGKNIMGLLTFQSISQINKVYGKDGKEELFDSCQCFVLCSGVNPEFAEWLSKKSGRNFRATTSKSINDDGKVSHSESMVNMEEITAGEFANLQSGKELIIMPNGMKPCKVAITFSLNVPWVNEILDKFGDSEDMKYGEKSNYEIDYFKDILNPDIVKYWIFQNIPHSGEEKVSYRGNLAHKLTFEGEYSEIFSSREAKKLSDFRKINGGLPCLALGIVKNINASKESDNNSNLENQVAKNDLTENTIPEQPTSEISKYIEIIDEAEKYLKNQDFSDVSKIPNFVPKKFIILLGSYGMFKIEEILKTETNIENLIQYVLKGKYKTYYELYDFTPTFDDCTLEKLDNQFKEVYSWEQTPENIPFIIKLVDLMVFAFQNTEAAIKSSDADKECWECLNKYWKFASAEEMKKTVESLKEWQEELIYKLAE
ncbi:MAG: type IV secretory system conjugative DNA transfer family protein [Mycoplasmataceae bacterium]|nr:type IV secretory system conjugative DNA transfer family protein [Mycoplasmataceae bacterium]